MNRLLLGLRRGKQQKRPESASAHDLPGELVLGTVPAHPSVKRAQELLNAAGKLAEDLATVNPAVALGAKGGNKTAERGPEYFKQIAAMRKTKAGGRPRRTSNR
jgi:hypothetical protein